MCTQFEEIKIFALQIIIFIVWMEAQLPTCYNFNPPRWKRDFLQSFCYETWIELHCPQFERTDYKVPKLNENDHQSHLSFDQKSFQIKLTTHII